MIETTKSEIKQLAYKIPSILKITSILSDGSIIKSVPHSQNIELCSSLYGYKTFASLTDINANYSKSLFHEKLNKFYGSLAPEQLNIFTEILHNQKMASVSGVENKKHVSSDSCGEMWGDRYLVFQNALADQIIHISSLDHWLKNTKTYLQIFLNYRKLKAFLMELELLGLIRPLMRKYMDSLPSSTFEPAELQHGYIAMHKDELKAP